jgi:hypothetical protein
VAAKLSYWLLGTTPSDELLDRAANGDLDTPEGIESVVDDMLDAPEATEMVVELYSELLSFSRYKDVIKSDSAFTDEIAAELEVVARMYFERIYEQDMGLREILTSTEGFAGPALADLYELSPAPRSPSLVELGPERAGFFSQVPYLSLYGDDTHSDAIHRGVSLNYKLLCAKLPVPAFEVEQLSAPEPNQSDRQRVEAHTGIGTCGAACHGGYINPLGYAFENFDGLGRERDMDNGNVVDTLSAYPFESDMMTEFSGAPELMDIIANLDVAHTCFVKNLASYGLQRDIIADDQALLDQLTTVSMSAEGSIKGILRALAKSPAFRERPAAL